MLRDPTGRQDFPGMKTVEIIHTNYTCELSVMFKCRGGERNFAMLLPTGMNEQTALG